MKALEDAREAFLDTCEGKVYDAVINGDVGSAKYVLSTRGKSRGWGLGNGLIPGPDNPEWLGRITTINVLAVPPGQEVKIENAVLIRTVEDDPAPDDEDINMIEGDVIEDNTEPAPEHESEAKQALRKQLGGE
jgi:hypothetical protein